MRMPNLTFSNFHPIIIHPVIIFPFIIVINHIFQYFCHLLLGHISYAYDFIIRTTDNLYVDDPFWIYIQRIKGFVRPNIHKDIGKLPLIVIVFSIHCNTYCPVFRCLCFLQFLFSFFLYFIKCITSIKFIK